MATQRAIDRYRARRTEQRASRAKARLSCSYYRLTPTVVREHNAPVRVSLVGAEKRELRRVIQAHTSEQRLVLRANIVLLAYLGRSNCEIAEELHCDLKTVRKWRDRFVDSGLMGLLDKARSGRPPTFTTHEKHAVIAKVLGVPPLPFNSWTLDLLRDALMKEGLVQAISPETLSHWLRTADLKPHRWHYWLQSKDPEFDSKMKRIVDLYVKPPEDGIVVCVDEKTGIQALERKHPTRPLRRGRVRRIEFEYIRHGTALLLAAFNVRTGHVLGECVRKNDSETFIRFLKRIMKHYRKSKKRPKIYLIMDNGTTHRSKKTKAFLEQHQDRLVPVYTPTHASWLNQVEIWFSALSRHTLRGGNFKNRNELIDRIMQYIDHHNQHFARPYRWTYTGHPLSA